MASIHRFRDLVALNLSNGPTLYLTPKEAVTFSRALKACAMDVRRAPFVASGFGTATIPIEASALQSGRDYDQKRKAVDYEALATKHGASKVGDTWQGRFPGKGESAFNTAREWCEYNGLKG